MAGRINKAESNAILKGALGGAGGTLATVILTDLTIAGGLASGVIVVPLCAFGAYKITSWLRK